VYVKSEQDREKFIEDYYNREGIKLDKEKIDKNPGLRALAKLCLNSFWGKVIKIYLIKIFFNFEIF